MGFFQPQNPGLDGLDELTNAETVWVANAAALSYSKGTILAADTSGILGALGVGTNGFVLTADSGETLGIKWAANLSGDVVGPGSSTDDAIATFDSTTGKLLQNTVVTIAQTSGNIAGVGTLNTHTIPGGTGTFALTSDLTSYLPLAGGTMAGVIQMGTNKITGLGDPTNPQDAATMLFVENAVGFTFDYFFNDTSAGIGATGYLSMTDTDLGGGQAGVETTIGSSGSDKPLDAMFISLSGQPGVTELNAGVYQFHFHAQKISGGSDVDAIYIELWRYEVGTGEFLIGTSELSAAVTSKDAYNIHMVLGSEVEIASTDRLLVKFFANLGSGGGAVVTIWIEGDNDSRLSFQTSSAILSNVFVRRDGALPSSNDGAALGAVSTGEWSDLFLAEGGVINWDNGDLTLIQVGSLLTLAGGSLAVAGSIYMTVNENEFGAPNNDDGDYMTFLARDSDTDSLVIVGGMTGATDPYFALGG